MTFVDQIKKIGSKIGVDVTGSNVADCLNSLERGVDKKQPATAAEAKPAFTESSAARRKSRRDTEKTEI